MDDLIPTVDLSPFFIEGDEDGQKKAMEIITKACSKCGFFQIVNHGVPIKLLKRAVELSRNFFDLPAEEKVKSSSAPGAHLPAGYNTQHKNSPDRNEYLLMFPPGSSFNVFPDDPPEFKGVLEDLFSNLTKTGQLMERILNQCLGLPPNFFEEFNHDRNWDFMVALRYFPANENDSNGLTEHEDSNFFTFVYQDEAGGLQVKTDGEWIPVIPAESTLVVNISDVIQVMSNDKFKSATHRVVRAEGRNRHSFAFFYNVEGEKWVEPLPQFTNDIGQNPNYRGFKYSEYLQMRLRNKTHPPANPEDEIRITHYRISA